LSRHLSLVAVFLVLFALTGCAAERPERPNVLFIVIDTLRADHLPSYGYGRDTAPRVHQLLAEEGALVERAYSQAPWTLPSTGSLLTGRMPGELAGSDPEVFEIPAGDPTLAERLSALGYRTAGFLANPILHEGNGFARGFGDFYTPETTWEVLDWVDATTIEERALPWLEEALGPASREGDEREPFFLYLHYIDPHDPYRNPDVWDGERETAPWDPEYDGRVRGDWAQDLYAGKKGLPGGTPEEREADRRHLVALYDSEIRYVDRFVARVIEAIPEEVLEETLIVLTSDHGEEFLDHGGWKHSQTLYQEMLHVPLFVRWDGVIPAGTRVAGPVALLDLAPTVLTAAGAPSVAEEGFPGRDLLPALTGEEELPPRPVFAEHLALGPMRAAVVDRDRKLILFNRQEPRLDTNPLHRHLRRLDRRRMGRVELYDLGSDPGERENLAGGAGQGDGDVERLARLLARRVDFQEEGVRVVATGVPAGAELEITIRLDRPPAPVPGPSGQLWIPFFLAPEDRVEADGDPARTIRVTLTGDGTPKGVILRAPEGRLSSVEARYLRGGEGSDAPAVRVAGIDALPRDGTGIGSIGTRPPPAGDGVAVLVWRRDARATRGDATDAAERLKALGYLGG
jgi:arylsulfatase A-like enzyme